MIFILFLWYTFIVKKVVFVFLLILISHSFFPQPSMDKKESNIKKSDYITKKDIENNTDINLYDAWQNLDKAIQTRQDEQTIINFKKTFLLQLENQKKSNKYSAVNDVFEIEQKLTAMKSACEKNDMESLSRLMTDFYVSKELIYQKSDAISVRLIVIMTVLILAIMALLFFYQFTYARKNEIEKILKATNQAQEEERRRIALELHDSVAQQMRYVSILAEKISDNQLSTEIKDNQSECIENIRNACYTLSSIDIDSSNFKAILKNLINAFQKRSGIITSLIITSDVDFAPYSQNTFHHILRIISELLNNIEKHSQAHEVTVLIRNPVATDKMQEGLVLFVSDDGKGISAQMLEKLNSKIRVNVNDMHFGLNNIKLRLNEINGTIKYFSEEGEGTEVQIRIKK